MKKKLFALSTFGLFIISVILPAVNCKSIETNKTEIFLNNKNELVTHYLESPSSYEYGLKAGEMLGLQYRIIDHFASSRQFKLTVEEIKEQIAILEKYCPSVIEEFKGLSASTHIKLERLILLQNFLESILSQGCTATASTGNATKNNETFLTQTVDAYKRGGLTFLRRFIYSHLWVKKISIGYKYVFLGLPVLCEKTLLNEKGLALVGNDVIATKDKNRIVDGGPGIPFSTWYKLVMMKCKNITEVISFYKGDLKPSTQKLFSNDVWADAEGNIMDAEMTYHHLITVFGNSTDITDAPEGILWHANHHQWLDPNETGSVFPDEYPSSKLRAERVHELLLMNYDNITLEVLKEICGDHGGGFDPNKKDSGDICCHPDLDHILLPFNGITIKSIIIEPKNLIIYLANGSPCRTKYVEYDFSKIFDV